MLDTRINQLQELVSSMQRGEFTLSSNIQGDDEIALLGKSIINLSQSIDEKLRNQIKILEFTQKLNEGLFLTDILEYIYTSFHDVIPYNRIGFALLEQNGDVLRAHWLKSDSKKRFLKNGFSRPMQGSSLQEIVASKQPRIINDLEQYFLDKPNSVSTRLALAEGIRSSLTCPLISMGNPIGFLFFSSNEKNTYAHIHQAIFCNLADQLSSVVEKSKLYEKLYNANKNLSESRDALTIQATRDALTGLFNRGAISQLLEVAIARAHKNRDGIALLMMDIDHFKQVNDRYGHQAGDAILIEVAKRLKSVARRHDNVGRYGGEEFMVVFSDLQANNMEKVAERYRLVIEEQPFIIPGNALKITMSLGLSWMTYATHISEKVLVKLADTALYAAKDAGRNQLKINIAES
ncbi:MAG: sensor domain-containing diguanylate cyclase [Oceanospirillaceae bacterium]